MSYRNITVDRIGYQYTIGKGCVKIRGLGVWDKEDIGLDQLIVNLRVMIVGLLKFIQVISP